MSGDIEQVKRVITERKQTEDTVIRAQDFYLTLFEDFPALIWRSGLNAKCDYFNKAWLAFTGRKMEQELGDGWAEGVHPDDYDRCLKTYLDAFNAREPFEMEYRLRHQDGKYRWIIDFGTPFYDLDGNYAGYVGSCYDITERKQAKEILQKAHDNLELRVEERTAELMVVNEQLRQEITEHKKTEEELTGSREYLEKLHNSLGEVIFTIKLPERIIEYVNRPIETIFGYTPEEVVGQTTEMFYPDEDGYLEFAKKLKETIGQGKNMLQAEQLLKRKNGEIFTSEITITFFRENGEITRVISIVRDIAERKRMGENQAQLQKNLESLLGLANLVESDLKSLADYVLAEIVEMTESKYGFYGFLDEDERTMTLHSWSMEAMEDCKVQDKPIHYPIEKAGIWGDAVRKRKPIIVNNYNKDFMGKKGIPKGHVPLTRILSVPIFSKNKILALGAVANKESDYTMANIEQLSAFITNAQTILDRKKAEEALRESEEKYRTLIESSSDCICHIDLDGKIIYINPGGIKLNELETSEEVIGKDCTLAVKEEYKDLMKDVLEKARQGKTTSLEYESTTTKGKDLWWESTLGPIKDNKGDVVSLIRISRDITERKKAEEEMKRRLMKYKLVEGSLYLVKEPIPSLSLEAFKDLLKVGYRGVVISRKPEEKVKKVDEGNVKFLWISERGGENALPPSLKEIELRIEGLPRNSAVLIERLDYLVFRNGVKKTLSFVQHLSELAYLARHIVILSVDPSTFANRELRLLEKEAEEVEPLHKARLPEDLLETVRFVYKQNNIGVTPSHSDVGLELGISRPTVSKRIRRLVSSGYLLDVVKGNRKVLEMTERGRILFSD